jgi:hypothetical protein
MSGNGIYPRLIDGFSDRELLDELERRKFRAILGKAKDWHHEAQVDLRQWQMDRADPGFRRHVREDMARRLSYAIEPDIKIEELEDPARMVMRLRGSIWVVTDRHQLGSVRDMRAIDERMIDPMEFFTKHSSTAAAIEAQQREWMMRLEMERRKFEMPKIFISQDQLDAMAIDWAQPEAPKRRRKKGDYPE